MIDIGNRIKKALFDKGWTQKKLCLESGLTENGLKKMMDSNKWKLETIESIARILDLPLTYFVSESEQIFDSPLNNKFKGGFLEVQLEKLEANFSRLSSQLERKDVQHEEEMRAKNQQIANLHEMLKLALVGKPNDVASNDRHVDPKIIVHPAFVRRNEAEVHYCQLA